MKNKVRAAVVVIALLVAVKVFAQAVSDPCYLYPHKSAFINGAVASPTFKIISGTAGQQIYVCRVTYNLWGSSPSLTLAYGVQVAGTPCATGSPYGSPVPGAGSGTVMQLGGGTVATISSGIGALGGDGGRTLMVIPGGPASPGIDLCGLTSVTGTVSATIDYVPAP